MNNENNKRKSFDIKTSDIFENNDSTENIITSNLFNDKEDLTSTEKNIDKSSEIISSTILKNKGNISSKSSIPETNIKTTENIFEKSSQIFSSQETKESSLNIREKQGSTESQFESDSSMITHKNSKTISIL